MAALTAGLVIGLQATARSVEVNDSFVTAAVYSAEVGNETSAVRTVSHSTGKSGNRLTWHPRRPSKDELLSAGLQPEGSETSVQFAQFNSPALTSPTNGGTADPFDDPFGDGLGASEPSQPKPLVTDEVLEGSSPRLLISGSVPQLPVDGPGIDLDASDKGEEDREPQMFLKGPLVMAPDPPADPCSDPKLESISEITHDISAKGDKFPDECPLIGGAPPQRQVQGWAPITFTWKASGLCHKPLYFDDVHLEVYGHSWGPYLQPVISGAHFFLTVPVLPYKMGLYPPHECIYSLGYYRPGSCAPYMLDPLPISIRAALAEAGVITGMVYLIP